MANSKLLCVISPLRPDSRLESYTAPDGKTELQGRQTNEAPVKQLLVMAERDHTPVTDILCLVSPAVVQPINWENGTSLSAYDFFCAQVTRFCQQRKLPVPAFPQIAYQSDDFADCITEVCQRLEGGDSLYIDTTGGPRDAVSLLMLSAQVLCYKEVDVQSVLYSNYERKVLEEQSETYRLIDLIGGMEAFTRYGRAEKLKKLFEDCTVPEVKQLCDALERFSDNLLLGNVTDLETQVETITEGMTRLENARLTDATSSARLFQSLMPTMRRDFVCAAPDRPLLLALLRWCTQCNMLQTALPLFRERIPIFLFSEHILEASDALERCLKDRQNDSDDDSVAWHEQLANVMVDCLEKDLHPLRIPAHNQKWRKVQPKKDMFRQPQKHLAHDEFTCHTSNETLADLLGYNCYLRCLRNIVMHASDKRKIKPYIADFARSKNLPTTAEAIDTRAVQDTLQKALDTVERALKERPKF